MASERHVREYFADNGSVYLVLVPNWWTNLLHRQWDAGSDPGIKILPKGYIMRHLNLKSADGKRRRNYPCSRKEAGWWPFKGASLVMPNADGTTTTWNVVGYNSEKFQPRKYAQKRR